MQTIKDLFSFLDASFAVLWGYTTLDLLNIVLVENVGVAFSTLDNIIKVLFSIAGLAYTVIRMHHFYHKSKIERAIKREELEMMEKNNDKN